MSAAPKIDDMSSVPLRVLPARTRRAEQLRRAKQAQRARAAQKGLVKVEIHLTAEEAFLVNTLRNAQQGSKETFFQRSLVVGAKFNFNSGNVRGGKKRIKRRAS